MVAGAGLLRYCRELSASEPQPAMAAPGRVKWWEKEPEPTTVWRACLTDDGLDYYVNTESNEVYGPPVHTLSLFPRPPPARARSPEAARAKFATGKCFFSRTPRGCQIPSEHRTRNPRTRGDIASSGNMLEGAPHGTRLRCSCHCLPRPRLDSPFRTVPPSVTCRPPPRTPSWADHVGEARGAHDRG